MVSNFTQKKLQSYLITNMWRFISESFIRMQCKPLLNPTLQCFFFIQFRRLRFYKVKFVVLSTLYNTLVLSVEKNVVAMSQIIEQQYNGRFNQNVNNVILLFDGSFDFLQNRKVLIKVGITWGIATENLKPNSQIFSWLFPEDLWNFPDLKIAFEKLLSRNSFQRAASMIITIIT